MRKTVNRENDQSHNRREFLKQGATAAAGLGLLSFGLRAQPLLTPVSTLPLLDKPGTHNMLVVGEQTAYLSHLPMFDGLNRTKTDFTSQHRYQVILEATFANATNATNATNNLTETYLSDRRGHAAEKMYSINPALFVLPDLDPMGKALKSFRGNTVYRGHLERENTPIIGFMDPQGDPPAAGVFDVNVTRVIHFHKFSPAATKPAQLQYILFGKGSEIFLAHFIAKPPDFDQVIGVKLTGQQFTDEQLASGMLVTFAERPNTAKTRLREGAKASTTVQLARFDIKRPPTANRPGITELRPGGGETKPFQVEVIREFYFEEGELRTPPTFDPTMEEKKSGFLE